MSSTIPESIENLVKVILQLNRTHHLNIASFVHSFHSIQLAQPMKQELRPLSSPYAPVALDRRTLLPLS
jgi:hypothetical protein